MRNTLSCSKMLETSHKLSTWHVKCTRGNPHMVEAYSDATSEPYSYLFVDLKPCTDDKHRLKSCIFPDDKYNFVYVPKYKPVKTDLNVIRATNCYRTKYQKDLRNTRHICACCISRLPKLERQSQGKTAARKHRLV